MQQAWKPSSTNNDIISTSFCLFMVYKRTVKIAKKIALLEPIQATRRTRKQVFWIRSG